MRQLPIAVVLLLAMNWAAVAAADVIINEFLTSNDDGLQDEDLDYPDWIELHNTGAAPVGLAGWTLTDDAGEASKWIFPSVTLNPNQYLVVFASGKDRKPTDGGNLHTNFRLSASGEYLSLSDSTGTVQASSLHDPEFPPQSADVSYGRHPAGPGWWNLDPPTPGGANDASSVHADVVADTKFSVNRGFFDAPFTLVILTETADATIRYTLDGSTPTLDHGDVYSDPILIAGTSTVRAAAFKTDWLPTNVDTQTYLFLDDIIAQSPNGESPPGWPSLSMINDQVFEFGMDPRVTESSEYASLMEGALLAIPSMSIVTDLDNLVDPATGIYVNARQDGRDWERPISLELINPDGSKGFQVGAGLRIRGGSTRSGDIPKHAWRLFFREEYGDAKLKFPLFGDEGADEFDKFDLRTNRSAVSSSFLRDVFSRDSQRDLGQPYTRSRFYHLYINGVYWGVFQTQERPEARYAESYFGGDKDDYDVIKTGGVTDGNGAAWSRLGNATIAGFETDAAYYNIQGMDINGVPDPANEEKLLDLDAVIAYQLIMYYTGNLDGSPSWFGGNTGSNNYYWVYNRENPDGFKHFMHDAEHTLRSAPLSWSDIPNELYRDRTGPYTGFDEFGEPLVLLFPFAPFHRMCNPCHERVWSVNPGTWNPQWAHMQLMAHPEYQMTFADQVHRHFFNGGVFTPDSNDARLMSRAAEIDQAIIAESARWGDTRGSGLSTRNDSWLRTVNTFRNNLFPFRTAIVLDQIKAQGWYPATEAPVFVEQHGGAVASTPFSLNINNPNGGGTIYYTLDGSDPRGRATLNPPTAAPVLPGAIEYSGAIPLTETTHVTARVLDGGEWSALNEATFVLPKLGSNLRITEMMYHPMNPDSLAEYIELQNVGGQSINLINTKFTEGIHFTFPQTILAPGEYVVLARNAEIFNTVYGPGRSVIGEYVGALDDAGERIRLEDPAGATILDFEYKDDWYPSTDGDGFSLVVLDVEGSFDDLANWCVSSATGGTPGAPDAIGCAPQPSLNVEPLSISAPPDAGTFEVSITNVGDGLLEWSAEVVLGESWLSLDAAQGQDDGTVRGSYVANGLFVERVGTLRVTAIDAVGSPRDITITQAAAAATISATPDPIEFGAVDVGSSATGSATVTNTGDAVIEGVAATSPPFAIESGEAYTLLPGDSHLVVVRFTPIGNGAVSGALRLSGGGSAVVELVAEGLLDAPDSDISVTPVQIEFGALEVGLSATETLTISNGGQIVLEGSASTSPPYSIVSGRTYAIFPGASHQVAVRFTPTESGTANGSLSLSGGGGATVPLLGSGIVEDEPALSLCEASDLIQSEFDAFKNQFGISGIDFDADGFPEFYALALVKAVCTLDAFFEIESATSTAFDINLMALESEGQFAELTEYKHAVAALMLVSQDTQAAVRATLSANGIELSGTYEAVTGIDGAFMPSAVPGKSLEEGYLIFDSIMKGENEPYSASGDFDGDGVSNLDEYIEVVVNGGGSLEDFINAATGGGGEGEGEGEGEGPGCAATTGSAIPISGDVAIILLALLFLVYRGNRRKHYSV